MLALNMQHEDLDAYADEQLHADDVTADVDRGLAQLAVPAVVIHGVGDKLVEPQHGRRLAALLPHARLVMVSGGHMAPYVHPAVVAAAVANCSHRVDRRERRELGRGVRTVRL